MCFAMHEFRKTCVNLESWQLFDLKKTLTIINVVSIASTIQIVPWDIHIPLSECKGIQTYPLLHELTTNRVKLID